jgi:uncharacterized protein YjbI with pentapeptide repeats
MQNREDVGAVPPIPTPNTSSTRSDMEPVLPSLLGIHCADAKLEVHRFKFTQGDICNDVVADKQSYPVLHKTIQKHAGLCELISNYVLLNDLMGRSLSATDENHYKLITVDDVNTMRHTHVLTVSSIFKKMLAYTLNIYPDSLLNRDEQKKLMKNGTVNVKILDKYLSDLPLYEYVKYFSYAKRGLKFTGHTCLVKKTGSDTFSLFDPNQGEYCNLSVGELASLMDVIAWGFNNTDMLLQRTESFKKHLQNNVLKPENDIDKLKSLIPADEQSVKKIVNCPKEYYENIFKSEDRLSVYRMLSRAAFIKFNWDDQHEDEVYALYALACDNVHTINEDRFLKAMSAVKKSCSCVESDIVGKTEISNIIFSALDILRKYLQYNAIQESGVPEEVKNQCSSIYISNFQNIVRCERPFVSMARANFRGADLSNTTIKFANLKNVNFMHANLADCTFYGINFHGTNFSNSNCNFAKFKSCGFERCHFDNATFMHGSFTTCSFVKCSFINTDLRLASIEYRTTFYRTSLKDANLRGARFRQCTFDPTVIKHDQDLLPENWRTVPDGVLQREHCKDFYRDKMTVVENIIRNLNACESVAIDEKIEFLTYVREHPWLNPKVRLGFFQPIAKARNNICKKTLSDEIYRLMAMESCLAKSSLSLNGKA